MGKHDHVFRPSDLRKAVTEWAASGFTVIVGPDGSITVKPPTPHHDKDEIDLIDFERK
jgi:hypothetical protein